jgi:hypothetical protein
MLDLPFYHGTIRNTIVAFGSLFSRLSFTRKGEESTDDQTIIVPIAYAQKEKWVQSIEQNADGERGIYTPLPKLAFELVSISYDPTRKLNRNSTISCPNPDSSVKTVGTPVPYNIGFDLHFATKTQGDSFQILEQILPNFSPEMSLAIRTVPELNIIQNVPFVLNSVSFTDDYEGDLETRRFVVYTLNFTAKINLYNGVNNSGLIKQVEANLPEQNALYIASQLSPSTEINESWTHNI